MEIQEGDCFKGEREGEGECEKERRGEEAYKLGEGRDLKLQGPKRNAPLLFSAQTSETGVTCKKVPSRRPARLAQTSCFCLTRRNYSLGEMAQLRV